MQNISNEVLVKIKELRNIAYETDQSLERSGLSITDVPKAQLFDNNIKNIIGAIESLLRNEAVERPILRLKKDVPDAYLNISKIKKTNPGSLNSVNLDRIKQLIEYLEDVYDKI